MKKKTFYLILFCAVFLFVCCEKTTISPENKDFGLLLEEPIDTFHQRTFLGPYGTPIAITREQFHVLGNWRAFNNYWDENSYYLFCDNDTCYRSYYDNGMLIPEINFKYIVTADSLLKFNDNPMWNEDTITRHKYYFIGNDTLVIEHFIRLDIDVYPPQYNDLHLKKVYR